MSLFWFHLHSLVFPHSDDSDALQLCPRVLCFVLFSPLYFPTHPRKPASLGKFHLHQISFVSRVFPDTKHNTTLCHWYQWQLTGCALPPDHLQAIFACSCIKYHKCLSQFHFKVKLLLEVQPVMWVNCWRWLDRFQAVHPISI